MVNAIGSIVGGMTLKQAFDAPGKFYKGNIHGHSTLSDGKLAPEAVVEAYQSRSWDFLSLTDHFLPESHFRAGTEGFIRVTDTSQLQSADFVTIPGAEVHAPALVSGDLWHFVAVGLPLDFAELSPEEQGIDIARRAYETGAFMGVAHPAWYTLTIEETLPMLPYMHAIETYNQASCGVDRGQAWYFADDLYTRGHQLSAYAADDAHHYTPRGSFLDAFGGWVQVKSESLEADALVEALKAGNYYSSTGPELEHIAWDGETLQIHCSPVERILVTATGARSEILLGEHLTEATFQAGKENGKRASWADDSYFRVTAIAADGTCAWSQPFWNS